MGFHNPFIKDGLIRFPDNGSLVRHVERWAKVRGDKVAYRFLDFSTERDGVARDLTLGRLRRTQQGGRRPPAAGDRARRPCRDPVPAEPGVPRRLLRHALLRPHRGAAVRPERARPRRPAARRPRRLPPVGHPDHHRGGRGRAQVLPQQAGQGASARHRRRRGARRGRRHLGAGRRRHQTPSPTCSTPPARPASRPACRSRT